MGGVVNGERIVLRPAEPTDLPQIERLMAEGKALSAGDPHHLGAVFVAEVGGTLVGVAAMELFGGDALVRAAYVVAEARAEDIGMVLVEGILTEAAMQAADSVYLLTSSAERFFARFGFMTIAQEDLPSAVFRRAELTDGAPATAIAMRLKLLES